MVKFETLITDLDGCLTDGKQYVDRKGDKMFKSFHSKDIRAIKAFLAQGVRVIVWSADDWEGGVRWCERVGAEFVEARDKLATLLALELVDPETTLIVGDDSWDIAAMKRAGWAACPHDADTSVHQGVPDVIDLMYVNGGQGVLAALYWELAENGLPPR
jgi:3-deoxy-D-manno-octulosonate 8-phosphate phosphatase KdsC-like HAD superfamily phosphatase